MYLTTKNASKTEFTGQISQTKHKTNCKLNVELHMRAKSFYKNFVDNNYARIYHKL